MITGRKQILFITLAVAVLGGSLVVGRWQGLRVSERMKARLELRWPTLMALPETDRALIVRAAIACDLLQQSEPTAGSVEACVREGAAEIGARVPVEPAAAP